MKRTRKKVSRTAPQGAGSVFKLTTKIPSMNLIMQTGNPQRQYLPVYYVELSAGIYTENC